MKIKLDTTTKPDPSIQEVIAVRLVESWTPPGYEMLFSTKLPYPHFYDSGGEEVPIGAIEAWAEVE